MTDPSAAPEIQAILEGRARKLAATLEVRRVSRGLGTFAIIGLGSQQLGLPVLYLSEIARTPPITPLPNLPPSLRGIALVRGRLVCVIDLLQLHGLAATSGGDYLAVLRTDKGELGILADKVLGFRELQADDVVDGVADPAAHTALPSQGTTRDLVTLLDVHRLFADPRIVVDAGSGTDGGAERESPRASAPGRPNEEDV